MRKSVVFAIVVSGALTLERTGNSSPAAPRRPVPRLAPAPNVAPSIGGGGGGGNGNRGDPSAQLARVEIGGITAVQVGTRAAATAFVARSEAERLRGAVANVDLARKQYLPRLTVTGRYTRLSDFIPPVIFAAPPGVNQVYTMQPVGPPGSGIDPARAFVQAAPAVTFPNVLDNYLVQATVIVPVSDYFLRLGQTYAAATHAARATRFDVRAARAKSAADGEIVYWSWLLARGTAAVAALAVADQRLHLDDAKSQFTAGNASRVDVLRAETAVHVAELQLERARNLAELGEKQVRIAVHARDDERLVPGEGLDGSPPSESWGRLANLTREALDARPEVKSIDASAAAARAQAQATVASALPQMSAFADAIDANPNPRRIPQAPGWFPTWQAGVQVTWSPNDLIARSQVGTDADVRAAQLEAARASVRDGVELEVLQALQAVHASDVAREVTARELESASEAQRVARQLFNSGRATSTLVADAQTELTRARLEILNAGVDARVARVRMRHALGRDTRSADPSPSSPDR